MAVEESKSQAVEKWRALFPENMSTDSIYTILRDSNFDDDKIRSAIARIWDDPTASAQESEDWESSAGGKKKGKKKDATGGKGSTAKANTKPLRNNMGGGKGDRNDGGKGRGRSAPPASSARPNPRGTGRGISTGAAVRGGPQPRAQVNVAAASEPKQPAAASTWASTTSAVGGGWATTPPTVSKEEEKETNKPMSESDPLGMGLTLSASAALPSVSAWSRGSASIISAAKPPPAPTPAPTPVPPPAQAPANDMQMPSTVNVNSLLDEDDDLDDMIGSSSATKTSVIPSSSDLSMTLEAMAPVESNNSSSSDPSSPVGRNRLGKFGNTSNQETSEMPTFNFGSFGDSLESFGDSSTWSNSAGTGGWGDADTSSSATSSKKKTSTSTNKTSDVLGFFEDQVGDGDALSSSLNGPPGLSAPKLELDQMKTVEELEAEQKAAAIASSTSSTSKPSAPPGMSEQAQNTNSGSQSDKGPNNNQNNHQEQHSSKPNKKHNGRRNNNNNNNQHNMDKNNMAMMHHGYAHYGGYPMDPSMYGYPPNMMMPGGMNHLQQPNPGHEGPSKAGGGGRSNLVDEGVNNGSTSPNSASRPTLGYGMPGYMPGFTAPHQNPYFYGGYPPGGYMVPPVYPQHNNMDPNYYGMMDGGYGGQFNQPQQGGGGKAKGGKGNSNDKNGSEGGGRRNRNNNNQDDGNVSPTNGGGNAQSWNGYAPQGGTAEQNMLWQQQQAYHMMQGGQGGQNYY